jgi:hypothetical protein
MDNETARQQYHRAEHPVAKKHKRTTNKRDIYYGNVVFAEEAKPIVVQQKIELKMTDVEIKKMKTTKKLRPALKAEI